MALQPLWTLAAFSVLIEAVNTEVESYGVGSHYQTTTGEDTAE
jgi:hypothetical protein